MKLIFELGVEGRGMTLMPECDVPEYQLPEERSEALHLPHVSETSSPATTPPSASASTV